MSSPRFLKAMEGAMRGKERIEEAVGQALEQMNVPTRTELKRALSRIETLEREVTSLKVKAKTRPAAPRKPVPRKAKAKAE
jgi:polyhydroxyalkanoate synthesis regulator phasin